MKSISTTLCILSVVFLTFSRPVMASHCQASTTGCSSCTPPSLACSVSLVEDARGSTICCKDFDGDGMAHYVTCDWAEYTCYVYCQVPNPDGSGTTTVLANQFSCTVMLGCQVNYPITDCTPNQYTTRRLDPSQRRYLLASARRVSQNELRRP